MSKKKRKKRAQSTPKTDKNNPKDTPARNRAESAHLGAQSELTSVARGDTRPSDDAIGQFVNDAETHVASQDNLPAVLRPAIFHAEANCRANEGHVMAVATIDGKRLVPVPDGCEKESLFHFLWDALVRSGGKSICFSYAGDDERLWVIYMDKNEGYVASAPIAVAAGAVRVGEWAAKKMERAS